MWSSDGAYRFLDVGGTFIKCADGRMIPVVSQGKREGIEASLREAVGDLDGIQGIGIAIPGPFDYQEGIFRMDHKFAAVKGLSFREIAGIPDAVSLRFGHDVNTQLEGAIRMLDLRGNTALVTLGTGLGFAYAEQGKVQYAPNGSPRRNLYNLPWNHGILEDAVSGRGIRSTYASRTGELGLSAHAIAQRAYAGDHVAMETYSQVGSILGEALAPVLEELEVTTVLFSGQITRSMSLMERPLKNALQGIAEMEIAPEGAVYKGLELLFCNQ